METFVQLLGSLLAFVYHGFDRIVIQGHLPLLAREPTSCTGFAMYTESTRSLPRG